MVSIGPSSPTASGCAWRTTSAVIVFATDPTGRTTAGAREARREAAPAPDAASRTRLPPPGRSSGGGGSPGTMSVPAVWTSARDGGTAAVTRTVAVVTAAASATAPSAATREEGLTAATRSMAPCRSTPTITTRITVTTRTTTPVLKLALESIKKTH